MILLFPAPTVQTTTTVWEPALVAAVIAALVSLIALWSNTCRARTDRQRQLFAEAFAAVIDYREFIYRIRRRPTDDAAYRSRLSSELSDTQANLNHYMAVLRVESDRVGTAYAELVAATRRIAGPQIATAWDTNGATSDADMHVRDVALSSLESYDKAYLNAVREHLRLLPGAPGKDRHNGHPT